MTENQTIEITPTIAHPDFMAVHPELYHYTNLDGLKGILSTKSLWATHFANLNDSTEVILNLLAEDSWGIPEAADI